MNRLTGRGRQPTLGEEIANSITHGIGAALSIAGLVVIVAVSALHRPAWQTAAYTIFGTSLVLLYMSSTIYHALANNRAKRVFKILDHSSIYLLIAGTYTPVTLIALRGPRGWALFGVVWVLCVCGIVFKSLWIDRLKVASTAVYLLMGWCAVFAIGPLFEALPRTGFVWLVAGGFCYTAGVAFYANSSRFAHSVWHLFVMAGSWCQYWAIFRYVLCAPAVR
jgi:hemolysin III